MSRRQIAAAETEAVVVAAAAKLFLDRGYSATSVAHVAREAGVAVQTIYNSVGSKRDLLRRALDVDAAKALFVPDQLDPERVIEELVEFWRGALPRAARLVRLIREVAAVDSEVAALERHQLANYEAAATLLELPEGLTVRRAAATIFAIGHPDVYRSLVIEGGWDDSLWATWARTALKAALVQ